MSETAKIAAALHQVMQKVGYVQKTGTNQFHGYRYASEADLLDKLRPAMIDAGLLLLPSVKDVSPIDEHGNIIVRMEYTLAHKDGEVWPEKLHAVGCGNDRSKTGIVGDKGVYKAITGANKYVLFKLFQIETHDDPENDAHGDPHAAGRPAHQSAPAQQQKQDRTADDYVNRAIEQIGVLKTERALMNWWSTEKTNRDKYRLSPDSGAGRRLMEAFSNRRAELQSETLMAG